MTHRYAEIRVPEHRVKKLSRRNRKQTELPVKEIRRYLAQVEIEP